MKCIPASDVQMNQLEDFLEFNHQIKKDSLIKNGYIVENNNKIIGCFELEMMDLGHYWLRQLYIIKSEAVKLPVLLEYILVFAKEKQAKMIYAHSEQPVTDLLLSSLCFSLQDENKIITKLKEKGHWWSYRVS